MKKIAKIMLIYGIIAVIILISKINAQSNDSVMITFDFNRIKTRGSNQFAVWVADSDGKFIKTLYVTSFTGSGGYKKRPASISKWSNIYSETNLDAVTMATPASKSKIEIMWNYEDSNGNHLPKNEKYEIFIEGTSSPGNDVLYKATIDPNDKRKVKVNISYKGQEAEKSNMIENLKIDVI